VMWKAILPAMLRAIFLFVWSVAVLLISLGFDRRDASLLLRFSQESPLPPHQQQVQHQMPQLHVFCKPTGSITTKISRLSPDKPRIFIWQLSTDGRHNLGYMYEPFFLTMAQGVLSYKRSSEWKLHLQHICNPDSVGNAVFEAAPRKGDIFIWIGHPGSYSVGFKSLQKRGVHTVFFQPEPMSNCIKAALMPGASEVWTYSWRNIEQCAPPDKSFVQRYVPSGFLQHIPQTVHPAQSPPPTLFGDPKWRKECYNLLQRQLGRAKMRTIYNVWNSTAFQSFIQQNSLFFHLHKTCEQAGPVTAARMSNILSAGAIVISMSSYPKDAKEFDGLIIFASLEKMHRVYANISSLSSKERSEMGNKLRGAYARRFAPAAIFRRAGIYKLMDELLRGYNSVAAR